MLENKVALVTGASRGIGRAIAIALAAQGAAVVINYNGSEERARETADAIKSRGGRASLYRCSVGDFQRQSTRASFSPVSLVMVVSRFIVAFLPMATSAITMII